MKTKKLQLATLLVSFIALVSCIVAMCVSTVSVSAATYNANAIFTASSTKAIQAEGGQNVKFSFEGNENNTVSYNRNLAYKWFTKSEGDSAPVANYFSAKFTFDNADFTKFTVSFQSAENSKSDDGVAENKIVFFNDNGAYSVAFRSDDNKDVADEDLDKTKLAVIMEGAEATLTFAQGEFSGEYNVQLIIGYGNVFQQVDGVFNNVHGSYAKYSASKLIPLAFSAEVPEGKTQIVEFNTLNGQSFALDSEGKVKDEVAPVLVVNDDIKSFALGTKLLGFSYEVIDVCDSTVTKTMEYYQYNPEDTEVSYKTLTSSVKIFDKYTFKNDAKEYVSIKFDLKDDEENKGTYFVAWYAEDQTGDVTSFGNVDYLAVIRDTESPVYTCVTTDANNEQTLDENNEAYKDYVAAVADAAEGLRAGEGYSFYVPSLADLIVDNDTTYSGLSFTVYYRTDASSSTTTKSNLSYDDLAISVTTTGGYQFKVVAADKQGNKMAFYQNGNLVSVDSDNVWEIDAIPAFTFYVDNMGLEIEEVKELSYAYTYSNYSIEKFTFKGLSGYEKEYELFYLEGVSANDISYAALVEFANECYKNGISEDDFLEELAKKTGKDFSSAELRTINAWDDNGPEDEDDAGWDTHDNRYAWRESSFSFTPQETGYYIVRVEAVDKEIWSEHKYAYQIVYASSEVDSTTAPSYWIENNIVTVVFIAIALVLGVAAIVLWITLPSTETVESSKSSKKSSSKKKNDK